MALHVEHLDRDVRFTEGSATGQNHAVRNDAGRCVIMRDLHCLARSAFKSRKYEP
jgi:hypothetical protein